MTRDVTLVGIPEQGQLVEVRQRRYLVTEVTRSTLPPSLLFSDEQPHHWVAMTSVEDDALGEELEVSWKREPGARLHDPLALPAPKGFDAPEQLDAFLNIVRWEVLDRPKALNHQRHAAEFAAAQMRKVRYGVLCADLMR